MGAGGSVGGTTTVSVGEVHHTAHRASNSAAGYSQSGLAARRGFRVRNSTPLKVRRHGEGSVFGRLRQWNDLRHAHPNDAKHHIIWTDNFAELYALGQEVMPSGHADMEVRHAMRLSDSERVVIKLRHKSVAFTTPAEEKEWRMNTEFMLNLPKSGSIAQLYDVLEDSKAYYIVMELVEGQDLFETLDCQGRLPIHECKEIIRQLLNAVRDLHERGIIHKDLKLENVMIEMSPSVKQSRPDGCEPGFASHDNAWHLGGGSSSPTLEREPLTAHEHSPTVKLIDFDTVENFSPELAGTRRSKSRSVVGTDQYIAQEAYEGRYSPASDMFAVGVIAYKLLTGLFPFNPSLFDDEAGENWVGSPKMKMIQERVRRYDIDFSLPPFPTDHEACDLCRHMLAADEHERPQASQALRHSWLAGTHSDPSILSGSRAATPTLSVTRAVVPASLSRASSGANIVTAG